MPYIELVSRTTASLTCRAMDLPENAAGVNWYIGTSASDMPYVASWNGVYDGATNAYTFDGLQPDTFYYVKFLPYDTYSNRIDPAFTDSFTTASAPAISAHPADVTAVVGQTATFSVAAEGDGLTYQWRYSANGGKTWNNTSLTGYNTPTLRLTASTTVNGRQYRCQITDKYGNIITSDPATLTVVAAGTRPAQWSWESNVASGAAFGMTAAEFNRFIDRVFAFAAYKNASLSGSAGSYYVSQGSDMLASQVNAVRNLVATLNPPTAVPAEAKPDDAITAAFFNGLKDSLNSIT